MSVRMHPVTELFPPMSDEEFRALVEDIRQHGQREPVTLWRGQVIDGRNRVRACQELDCAIRTRVWNGAESDLVGYVVSLNLRRRHLNESQRALVADRIANMRQGERTDLASIEARLSQSDAAALLNVSRASVQRAHEVTERAPDLVPAIERGEMTVTQATRAIRDRKREERREENRAKVAAVPSPTTVVAGARFATIVIDPPWDYGDEGDAELFGRGYPDYATMPIEEIRALPVSSLADEDCHLYLWITNRSLPKGFGLLEAWGFRYVTCLTWCKPSIGMGNYFRGTSEHLLFGVKGSQPLRRKDVGTWFAADRVGRKHSAKPAEAYTLIESCSPGPYLEMFARQQRDGWVAWGEEVGRVA